MSLDLDLVRERFESSTDFTVGLEEEFAILDPASLELVHRFEDVHAYRRFTAEWLPAAARAVEDGGTLAIWTNFLGRQPILAVAGEAGFPALAGEYVWAKLTTEGGGNERLARVYEVALVLRREPLPPLVPGDAAWPWAVLAGYDDDGEAARWGSHPNHKPFGVLEPLIRTWSRPGELVLDCFAGSGSIPAAALRLGREVACIELEMEWAQRVTRRMQPDALPELRTLS